MSSNPWCVEFPIFDDLEGLQDQQPGHGSVEIVQNSPPSSRKTTKTCKPPLCIKHYVVPKKSSPHSMTNHVCYDNVSKSYQCYLHAFSAVVESQSFNEASKTSCELIPCSK